MKDFITLEINTKKHTLGTLEIKTPNEFLLMNTTESIVNCKIFEQFIDEIFIFITEYAQSEFKEKIDNVYITFINNEDIFICTITLDKINKKKGTYKLGITDWQASGCNFKYVTEE